MPPPRTNKQYKRFMQQQQQAAAAQAAAAAAAGTVGCIPSPNAVLLAAALASSEGSETDADAFAGAAAAGPVGWLQANRGVHRHSDAAYGRSSGLTSQQHMVHQVLRAAGAGLDVLQQAVSALQQHTSAR
jgi:hypothetical protein